MMDMVACMKEVLPEGVDAAAVVEKMKARGYTMGESDAEQPATMEGGEAAESGAPSSGEPAPEGGSELPLGASRGRKLGDEMLRAAVRATIEDERKARAVAK